MIKILLKEKDVVKSKLDNVKVKNRH